MSGLKSGWAAASRGTGVHCRSNPILSRVAHMGPASAMMTHNFQSSHKDLSFGPWKLMATKVDKEKLSDKLHMPSLPEIMLGDTFLRIQHCSGFGIEICAADALRCVNNYQGMLQVACVEEWQGSRNTPRRLLNCMIGPTQQVIREHYLENHSN